MLDQWSWLVGFIKEKQDWVTWIKQPWAESHVFPLGHKQGIVVPQFSILICNLSSGLVLRIRRADTFPQKQEKADRLPCARLCYKVPINDVGFSDSPVTVQSRFVLLSR